MRTQGRDALKSLGKGVRYLVFTLAACLVSMGLSYHFVLYMLRNVEPAAEPSATLIREVEELQVYSNTLLRLTAEFLRRPVEQTEAASETFPTWLERDFRPRLNNLRRRMRESPVQCDSLTALLSASDAVAAMAAHPEQQRLGEIAANEVLDATAAVQDYVASSGVDGYVSVRAELPQFD